MARFTRIVPFGALDKGTLREILRTNVIDRLTREFDDEGFRLVVDDTVMDHIVNESLSRETGARGLASILTRHIEDAAFEAFAEQSGGEVRVGLREDKIVVDISG
jgi:ATP-dependent Clp protease ATP-binding subunit ClpA